MTISSSTIRWSYTGTGSNTVFAYTARITDDDYLTVISTDTTGADTVLTKTTHYTVSGVGTSGGNVTLVTALTLNYTLTILLEVDVLQETDIRNQGAYFAETHEEKFDYLTRIDQQQQDQLDRTPHFAKSVDPDDFDNEWPYGVVGVANAVPMTNDDGDGWADADDWPTGTAIANASTYATQAAASAAAAAVSAGTLSPYGINNLGLSASVAGNNLTISILEADGSSTPSTGTDSVTIYFRSATATNGSMTARSVTSATTLVVPSGATLGHNDGVADYLYVYAIDNAGTVELAISSSSHWNEGDRSHDTTAISTSSDDAATLYSTSARTNIPIRLIAKILSNQTTAGTWASAITRIEVGFLQKRENLILPRSANFIAKHGIQYSIDTSSARTVTLPTPRDGLRFIIKDVTGNSCTNAITLVRAASESIEGVAASFTLRGNFGSWAVYSDGTNWFVLHGDAKFTSEVAVDTGNGHGSTATHIRRFSNIRKNVGGAITYADSAANGGSFTINYDGVYTTCYSDATITPTSGTIGISVNAASLTTSIGGITYANGKRAMAFMDGNVDFFIFCSWTGRLSAGDVIRAHTSSAPDSTTDNVIFTICQVGR